MNCEERREQFLLDAIGALSPEESRALRAHLATGCVACAASAAEGLAVAANYAASLPPLQPDAAVLDRLMRRISASVPTSQSGGGAALASGEMRYKRRRWTSQIATGAIAAALAAAVTAGIMWSQMREQRLLRTDDLRYVSLAGADPQPKAHGRIFWDADHGYWHVYVFDLNPPPTGKTYELWFIGSDGRKTRAGLFDVNDRGDANLVVQVPGNLGPLAAAAVTDESAGGSKQPTGTIQLLGKIQ
jgi:anti-sigma-K factor RskA